MEDCEIISVIGLGYVGLPVACAFGSKRPVIGYDTNATRIAELRDFYDSTHSISQNILKKSDVVFTADMSFLGRASIHIITVPTFVSWDGQPDLQYLISACETVGTILKQGDIVIIESTVYPGATEEVCLGILENKSGLKCDIDFNIGYSPERINPGDPDNQFKKINKLVSARNQETLDALVQLYSLVIDANIVKVSSIKIAETAKLLENSQRDINIALTNELAMLCDAMQVDTDLVIKAASTKWNFMPFKPGLVGGHCVAMASSYLVYKARQLGRDARLLETGRKINENMGQYIAKQVVKKMIQLNIHVKNTRVAILGITFKENCADIRNTGAIDIIKELEEYGIKILVHDPIANCNNVQNEYNLRLSTWEEISDVDTLILNVPHAEYRTKTPEEYAKCFGNARLIYDVKSVLDPLIFTTEAIEICRL